MNWVFFAAFIVASSAAKLDRTYLPPASAASAGGSPGSLLAPLAKSEGQSLPIGSFVNEHDGVVVDVASVGTRASQSGLGGPRNSYGSSDSKVGEAAFRETHQDPSKLGNNKPGNFNSNPDLSAFHQPAKPARTTFQISRDNGAHIIKYHNDIESDRYSYGFEADNGIKAEEKGVISNGVHAKGEFSYVGDDGKVYSVAYTADENGYRPVGSHLPTPPPIPVEILRALEQNSRDEAAGLSEDGSYDAQKYNTGDYTKSDANDNYNDRETIKFSIRPGSSSDIGAITINQNQGAFTKPNIIESMRDTTDNTKIESSKDSSQINVFGVNSFNKNSFDQGQTNLNAGIGSRKEFSQQKLQGSLSSNLGSSLINRDSISGITSPKPLSQQDLQESINSGQDNLRPSSYDTSFSTVVSNNVPSKLNIQPSQEYTTSPVSEEKKNQPIRFEQTFMKPTETAFTQNFGIKNTESKLKDENGPQNSFTTQMFHNQMNQNLNNRFSSSQSSTGTSFGFDQTNTTNDRIGSTSSFFPGTKPILPTKQPERVLTTPFESFTSTAQLPTSFGKNQDRYTGFNFANIPGLTSTSKFTDIPFTHQEINTKTTPQTQFTSMGHNDLIVTNSPFSFSAPSQNFHLLNQQYKPTENKLQTTSQFSSTRLNSNKLSQSTQDPNLVQSTQYNKQTHGQDTSYFNNKFSKPVITDSTRPDQQFPTTSSDQFDSSSISNQDTQFTDGNQNFISSTYSQDTSDFNRQTNLPTLSPSSQTAQHNTVTENKNSYQTNGITQASISSFPSIFSTSLNSKESGKINFKPFQQTTQINSQSQTQFIDPSKVTATGILQSSFDDQSNFNGNSNSQIQQYDNKIYEYNKPLQSFSSASGNVANKQQGHLGTQFTMTTPFRVNESVISNQNEQTSFEMQISSKFGKQDENLDKKTTPFESQPSTQLFTDKLTTSSIQNPTDVTETQNQDSGNTSQFEIYEYTKPLQSLTSTSPKEQINRNEYQETQMKEKINKQSTTAYTGSYTETTNDFQKEDQLTTQFNQEEFERKTGLPKFSQTASTFDSSIYQYTKPTQSFLTTPKQDYQTSQSETPAGVMSTNFAQHYSGAEEFGIQSTQDRDNSKQTTLSQFTQGNQPSITQFINTLSTPFPGLSQPQLSNRLNSENQENSGEIYNYKKPIQNNSSAEEVTKPVHEGQNPQFNTKFQNQKIQNQQSGTASLPGMLTTLTYQNQPNSMPISSDSEAENSYNSQDRPQQNSQLGEIYQYSKPTQILTTPAQDNILGQNIDQQSGQRLNQVNSKPNAFIQKLSGDSATTQNEPTSTPLMVTQTNFNTQDKFTKPDRTTVTQTSFTDINSKPIGTRPQFAFQSACCRGLQAQKHQEPQFTQSTVQNKAGSDLKNNQKFESKKLTTQGFITGEDFGGPRKPPSFDDKGYHY